MKLSTTAAWIGVTLCLALTFILGATVATCSDNVRLNDTISMLRAQHSAELRRYEQELSSCSFSAGTYKERYIFYKGVVLGLPLSGELLDQVDKIEAEVDRMDRFRLKLEKGLMRSDRRRR
jgi:hypothetical protein